jgi:hypothetical protein
MRTFVLSSEKVAVPPLCLCRPIAVSTPCSRDRKTACIPLSRKNTQPHPPALAPPNRRTSRQSQRACPGSCVRSGRVRSPQRFQSKKADCTLDGAWLSFHVGQK